MTSSPLESAPTDGAPVSHNPFVGPRPFQSGERLFGRLKETRELYYLLTAERIVWLHSPSGAGKTSLIWASLAPRLERDGFRVYPCIRVNLSLPEMEGETVPPSTNRYVMSTLLSLEEGLPPERRQSMASLAGPGLPDYLAGLAAGQEGGGAGTLLVFDQFEEILTVEPLHQEEKRVFFQTLGEALRNPSLWALFALREEYLAPLQPYIDWIPTRWSNTFRLDLLGESAVREVVQRTATLGGRTFTDPAAAALFADLARTKVQQPDGRFLDEIGRFVEPVQLQVVCRRLWDAMPTDKLSIDPEDLAQFGDVSQALGAYYDEAIARIASAPSGAADLALERGVRDWFGHRLVTPTGTRGQVLRGIDASEGLPNGVIETLLNTHLIRGEKRAGATWYELAHDRLIQPVIDRNRVWLEGHLQPFQRRAARWVEQGRPANGGEQVLRGRELKEALRFQRAHPVLVNEDESRLIGLSRAARRMRHLTQGVLSFIVLLILVFGVIAWWLKTQAEEKEREAWYQVAVGHWKDAVSARDRDPLTAAHHFAQAAERFAWARRPTESANALLALKFVNDRPLIQAVLSLMSSIHGAACSADGKRILAWGGYYNGKQDTARLWDSASGAPLTPLLKHEDWFRGAQFSRDQSRILTWSQDGTARLWDSASGAALTPPLRHEGTVWGARFSPDGSRILTWSDDGTARLWDGASGAALTPPLRHEGSVWGAQFSPDESRILTWSDDGTARLWESTTGAALTPRLRFEGRVWGAQFSPDGSSILTWRDDGTARLWDSASGAALTPPLKHEGGVSGAQFSPDGSRILYWSYDGTARLWDSASGAALAPPLKHEGRVSGAQFSPDGSRILTWSYDGTARLWDSASGAALAPPLKHEGGVGGAEFTTDGSRIFSWTYDGTARLWDSASGAAFAPSLKHEGGFGGAEFTTDGSRILSWSYDGTARLWDSASGVALAPPIKLEGGVQGAQFSTDGTRILTWGGDGVARLWDSVSGTPLIAPLKHERSVGGAQLSTNGSRILTPSGDFRTDGHRIVGIDEPPLMLEGWVLGAQFSTDGSRILTWGGDGTARLWDSASGAALAPPLKHDLPVLGAQFSPDGTRILTWSGDFSTYASGILTWGGEGAARVWDSSSGAALTPPFSHVDGVSSAQFSPDGSRILTWSYDGTARLWESASGAALAPPLKHEDLVSGAQFSPEGSRILTWSDDGTVRLWDGASGAALTPPLKHEGRVSGAQFSPDGSRILTWSYDGTARLWDSASGAALAPPLKHEGGVSGAQFSPDGTHILTWSSDGTARVWDSTFDRDWPAQKIVLRTEVETGTTLTPSGETKALSAADWQRKRWCGYDAIRHDLKRLNEAEWAESQRLCRKVQEEAPGP